MTQERGVPRGRRGRRLLVIAAVVVVCALAVAAAVLARGLDRADDLTSPALPAPTGSAAPMSSGPLMRFAAIEGSDSWLLYAQTVRDDKVPVVGQEGSYPRNERFLLGADGRRIAVPAEANVSLLGNRPLLLQTVQPPRFHISGVSNDSDRPVALRWTLPGEGTSGSAELPAHSSVRAYGPDATWVVATTIGHGTEDVEFAPIERLTRYGTSGAPVDLGVPFPKGAPNTVVATTTGLIAYSDAGDGGDYPPTGQIRFRPWSGGSWRTLNPGEPAQGEIACSTASARLFLCRSRAAGATVDRDVLYRLPSGSRAVFTQRDGSLPAGCTQSTFAADIGFLGISRASGSGDHACPAGRVTEVSAAGEVSISSRRYDQFHAPILAFGRIIVDEYREHRILALSAVDAAPQIVVGR